MTNTLERRLEAELEQFIRDGVYKRLNYLDSPQGPRVKMEGRGEVIILSSNNYLGLERAAGGDRRRARPRSTAWARVRRRCASSAAPSPSIARWRARCARLVGTAGVALVRELLERQRGGARAPLLSEDDLVISDQLNHASIIDGDPAGQGDHQVPDRRLQARRSRRPGIEARPRRSDRADPAGDHRRRVLDGGLDRAAARPAGGLPQARRGAGGGRLARDRRARRDRPRHGGALRHGRRGGHHHLHAGQGARRRRRRFRGGLGRACATTSPSAPGRSSSPTRCRRPWRRAPSPAIEYLEAHPERVTTPARERPLLPRAASRAGLQAARRARPRSSRSSSARPRPPSG